MWSCKRLEAAASLGGSSGKRSGNKAIRVGYQHFCKAANRVTKCGRVSASTKSKNLPPPVAKKEVLQSTVQERERDNSNKEKPAWQIQRKEIRERLDREVELSRQREAQRDPEIVFKVTPFVGKGEN
ncbi:MAG TPA: hypothetical protein VGD59_01115 [Acidisarcina sp.]